MTSFTTDEITNPNTPDPMCHNLQIQLDRSSLKLYYANMNCSEYRKYKAEARSIDLNGCMVARLLRITNQSLHNIFNFNLGATFMERAQ